MLRHPGCLVAIIVWLLVFFRFVSCNTLNSAKSFPWHDGAVFVVFDNNDEFSGNAFMFDYREGLIVTAYHVVQPQIKVALNQYFGDEQSGEEEILPSLDELDVKIQLSIVNGDSLEPVTGKLVMGGRYEKKRHASPDASDWALISVSPKFLSMHGAKAHFCSIGFKPSIVDGAPDNHLQIGSWSQDEDLFAVKGFTISAIRKDGSWLGDTYTTKGSSGGPCVRNRHAVGIVSGFVVRELGRHPVVVPIQLPLWEAAKSGYGRTDHLRKVTDHISAGTFDTSESYARLRQLSALEHCALIKWLPRETDVEVLSFVSQAWPHGALPYGQLSK